MVVSPKQLTTPPSNSLHKALCSLSFSGRAGGRSGAAIWCGHGG